ncbi:MAG: major facilitator superfamily 1 [Mucilaginibacter sp.]|jgi:OFA family oxalate/formate antiporter-like MFS transporter|nr:major facilitator superfamily 1 [Mucilaginibacter sp.]MDB5060197.1 major facilitator superfamily 1 [Mucilaginibacter sp.]
MNNFKRWGIAIAGILIQVALGAVYAWSVFRVPLAKQFNWSISEVTLTFTIAIMALGFASFFGGLWLKRVGPRVVVLTGGVLYGAGVFLASYSYHGLWWLYLTYGVIGGVGLGFSYIVPISVLVKWFPDRRGLMTGIAVGGFGAGALITAPVATQLIQSVGVLHTFAYLGIVYMIITVIPGYFMQNPPEGWTPGKWTPGKKQPVHRNTKDFTLGGALKTWQWWALWLLLFLNTSAGISIISQEAPLFQDLAKVTAIIAASMIGIVSIGNALGRVFWAWASDLMSRRVTFAVMFIMQIGLFWILPGLHSAASVTGIVFIILMCYGGGFGTMPAFVADYFGPTNMGSIYGLILTAWGFASAFGPLLIAHMRQTSGAYATGLHVIAGIMAVSVILPLLVRSPTKALAGRAHSDTFNLH